MFFIYNKIEKIEKKASSILDRVFTQIKIFHFSLSTQLMIMITMLMMVVGMVVKIILEPEAEIILILIGLWEEVVAKASAFPL